MSKKALKNQIFVVKLNNDPGPLAIEAIERQTHKQLQRGEIFVNLKVSTDCAGGINVLKKSSRRPISHDQSYPFLAHNTPQVVSTLTKISELPSALEDVYLKKAADKMMFTVALVSILYNIFSLQI